MREKEIHDHGSKAQRRDYRLSTYWLTSSSIAAHIDASDPTLVAIPLQWLIERRIFALPIRGQMRFPRYALDADQAWHPFPVIREVMDILGSRYGSWALAGWFVRPNPWINQGSPRALLGRDDERDRLLFAAWQERRDCMNTAE